MKYTGNYGFKKPEGTDVVNIDDLNANMDILDVQVKALADGKVDKVSGKGLSTEDYTSTEKSKLAGIAAGANNYVHPSTHSPSIIAQDSNNRFTTDAEKTLWNTVSNKTDKTRKVIAGTGLTGGGDFSADRTVSVSFGTTSTTVCAGNDARLSNARTPLAHDNAVHTVQYLPVINVTAGLTSVMFVDTITWRIVPSTNTVMAPFITLSNRFYTGSFRLNFIRENVGTEYPLQVYHNGVLLGSYTTPSTPDLTAITVTGVTLGDTIEFWGKYIDISHRTEVKNITIQCNEIFI